MTQARLIYDREIQEARGYWSARLSSISFAPFAPLDHPRPADGAQAIEALTFALDAELHAGLRRLTSGNASLLFAVLVMGLRLCGDRYGGRRETTVFVPTTGGLGDVTPIVEALPDETLVRDALLATRDLLTAAQRYQRYSLSHLRRQAPGAPDRLPLVVAMAGLRQDPCVLACDIAMLFEADEAGCAVTIRFDRRIYEPETMQGLFEALGGLLRQALTDMRGSVGGLRADGGRAGGSGATTPGGRQRLHQPIEAVARDAPERPAVVERAGVATFGSLVADVARLAAELASLGLDPRRPSAIMVDDGLRAIVAMLAVSRAGLTFAPIRPASLRRPLSEVLAALGCSCLIHGPEQDASLDLGGGLAGITHRVVLARAPRQAGAAPGVESATRVVGEGEPSGPAPDWPAATACVLIDDRAEGMTITPLGHGELLGVLGWLNQTHGVGPRDRALLAPGLGVCEALYGAFGPLMAGGGVEIADVSGPDQAAMLAERLSAPEITVWVLAAPLLRNLLSLLPGADAGEGAREAGGPRLILMTGPSQSAVFAARLARRFQAAAIMGLAAGDGRGCWSLYFPYTHLQSLDGEPASAIESDGAPVARTIPGFEHAVLNAAGQAVPLGVAGELQARWRGGEEGPGRWRGAGLRARPLGAGRWRWLRGPEHVVAKGDCRVELTGLEAALGRADDVWMVEALAVGDERRGHRVTAFVSGPPETLKGEALRDDLIEAGGADIIPDRIVTLGAFPLGPDGEIDIAALLASDREVESEPAEMDARLEAIRARLRPHWLRTLQQDESGDDDSFFGAGGNSLKATLLITRIKDEFGVALAVQDFFRKPTIRAIAQLIRAAQDARVEGDALQDLKPVPRDRRRVLLSDLEGRAETV